MSAKSPLGKVLFPDEEIQSGKGRHCRLILGGFVCGCDTQNCSSYLDIMRGEDKRKGAQRVSIENWEKYVTFILFLHSSQTNLATTPPLDVAM